MSFQAHHLSLSGVTYADGILDAVIHCNWYRRFEQFRVRVELKRQGGGLHLHQFFVLRKRYVGWDEIPKPGGHGGYDHGYSFYVSGVYVPARDLLIAEAEKYLEIV